MIPLTLFALATCLAVDAGQDHIRAADLARVDPAWEALAPDVAIALAPLPGVQRLMRLPELHALAARWKVSSDPSRELCFTRPVAPVAPDRMLDAMRRELPDARIELIEASRIPAPDGAIEFPRTGLRSGYWYGYVSYAAGRRFAIWARVSVTTAVKCVVTSADLIPGEPVDPLQLRIDVQQTMWSASVPVTVQLPEEIAGWIPRRRIPAGTAIDRRWLDPPPLVRRGDAVKVEVVAGAAMVHLDAVAEGAGALGDTIPVRNPGSGRRFRAQVEARGKVSVKGMP